MTTTRTDDPEAADLAAVWRAVENRWHDRARHDVLVALAVERARLPWLASRYRARAGDPIADAQLARVTRAATAVILAARPSREAPAFSLRPFLALLVTFAIVTSVGLACASAVGRRGSHASVSLRQFSPSSAAAAR